jgi:hypothetical protein
MSDPKPQSDLGDVVDLCQETADRLEDSKRKLQASRDDVKRLKEEHEKIQAMQVLPPNPPA